MSLGEVHPMLVTVAAFTCITVIAGCGDDDSANTDQVADHVGVYKAFGADGGDTALLKGTVRIIDGCFVVETEGARYVPYFPSDEVQWSGDGLQYGTEAFGDGAAIALGGGQWSGDPQPLPARCGNLDNLSQWTVAQGG